MALPKLEGLITVPSGNWTFQYYDGATWTVTIPAANYYLSSPGNASAGLLATVQYQLNVIPNNTCTVTMSSTTGKVTITNTEPANFQITEWTSTALRDVLGFTAVLGPDNTTFTSPEAAESLFLPNCGRGPSYLAPDGDEGAEESDLTIAVSPAGNVRAYGYGRRFVDALDFPALKSSKTWISDESTVNESLQRFWRAIMATGTRFRYYPQADVDGTYVTWIAEAATFQPKPVVPGWDNANALYGWGCNVRKYI